MKQRKIVVNLTKTAFLVLLIKVMASTSLIIPWNPLLDNASIVFAIGVMLVKLYRLILPLKKLIILTAVSLFTLYSCITIGQYELLITLITIILLIHADMEAYIDLMYQVQVRILLIHFALSGFMSLVGYGDLFWSMTDSRLRFNGGFAHANVVSCYILSCMLMFAWKQFRQLTLNNFLWMAAITLLTYLMTRSRTGLTLNCILLMLIFLGQNYPKFVSKLMDPILVPLFPALSVFVFWAQRQYLAGNPAILTLDRLMTGRIKYAAYACTRSGITLFPRFIDYAAEGIIPWTPEWNLNTFTFDNLYSFLFVQMGIVWIFVISWILAAVFQKAPFKMKIYFLIWVLYAMVEIHGFNCYKFFPPMLLCTFLSGKEADNPENS